LEVRQLNKLSIEKIKESKIIDSKNIAQNQFELTFKNEEKTAKIVLEGKGLIKVLTTV
jgi:hypothetical protein